MGFRIWAFFSFVDNISMATTQATILYMSQINLSVAQPVFGKLRVVRRRSPSLREF